jgi:hypothetical protein
MKNIFANSALTIATILLVSSCQKNPETLLPPAPSVYAGAAQIVTWPVDSVRLSGTAQDAFSRITGYSWSQVSGPTTALIGDDGAASTEVYGVTPGAYVFQLMATDSLGQTGVNTVNITVNILPKLPGATDTLRTTFSGMAGPYEWTSFSYFPGGPGAGSGTIIELMAEAWTVGGIETNGRSFFKFNMNGIPQGTTVKSATLYLFSDTIPQNGNLIDANYGTTNDFWIYRVSSNWATDGSLTWSSQPAPDTTGQVHVPQTSSPFLNLQQDVTTMVNAMLTNGNYGFEMKLNTEVIYNSRIFCSSTYADSTRHPYLVVTY